MTPVAGVPAVTAMASTSTCVIGQREVEVRASPAMAGSKKHEKYEAGGAPV